MVIVLFSWWSPAGWPVQRHAPNNSRENISWCQFARSHKFAGPMPRIQVFSRGGNMLFLPDSFQWAWFCHTEVKTAGALWVMGIPHDILSKIHCELSFIEQWWGFTKWVYLEFPASSTEADLEHNVICAPNAVPLDSMRRFVLIYHISQAHSSCLPHRFSTRSLKLMDAYNKGLTGSQIAWASQKYRGHRVLPDSILEDLGQANI